MMRTNSLRLQQVNQRTLSASRHIHQRIFHTVVFSTLDFAWSAPVGAVANRFSRDVAEMDAVLPNTLKNFLLQCARIAGAYEPFYQEQLETPV